jgi:L-threonylcarbamoyladenylate synthase
MRGSPSNAPDENDDALRVAIAARVIRSGRVVAHATEGVWGLACDPFTRGAVERVLELKGRSWRKGLIVIGADVDTFAPELAALDASVRADIAGCWPGAITWVVPNVRFPRWITGRHSTVAIRVPAHGQALRLCKAVGGPIVSTSANPSGRAPARTSLAVRGYFGHEIDAVLSGDVGGRGGPSEIRVALTGAALR